MWQACLARGHLEGEGNRVRGKVWGVRCGVCVSSNGGSDQWPWLQEAGHTSFLAYSGIRTALSRQCCADVVVPCARTYVYIWSYNSAPVLSSGLRTCLL